VLLEFGSISGARVRFNQCCLSPVQSVLLESGPISAARVRFNQCC